MAAITTLVSVPSTGPVTLRSVAAQASTGQTDWVAIPSWARQVEVTLNVTANAGTTPISTVTLLEPDPVTRDDTADVNTILTGAGITAASFHKYAIAPGIGTDSADNATADSYQNEERHVPSLLGVRVTNDRTTGDETYTYTLTVQCRR